MRAPGPHSPLIGCTALLLFIAGAHGQQPVPQPSHPPPAQLAATTTTPDDTEMLARQLTLAEEEAGSTSAAASTNGEGPTGIVPLTRGFNASLMTTSQHDSSGGWSNILTPIVAFRFSPHWSLNAAVPVYTYVNVSASSVRRNAKGVALGTNYFLEDRHFLLGDAIVAGEFETHPRPFDYNVTATLGLPTGDDAHGLAAGQATYNINNHFERPLREWLISELELGIGNSPNLTNERVRESYIAVGTDLHFQLGLALSLPWRMQFTTDAFEDLPLSSQTVTSTTTNGKKGKQLRTITTTSQQSFGEDNGFLNTLDVPLSGHVTLSGFYNRSLRNKIDTAGFAFTFTLRNTRHDEDPR